MPSFYPLSPIAHSWDMGMMRTVPSTPPDLTSDSVNFPTSCLGSVLTCSLQLNMGKSVAASTIFEAVATGVTIIPQESHSVRRVLLSSLNSIY